MASGALVSPDWLFSNTSNVSVAKEQGWFTSYTPFKTHLTSIYGGTPMNVLGIGSVEIAVKLRCPRNGSRHRSIHAHQVLHSPDAVCNILSWDDILKKGYRLSWGGNGSVKDAQGHSVVFFDETKILMFLKISGPPVGPATYPSLFLKQGRDPNKVWAISVTWPDAERKTLVDCTIVQNGLTVCHIGRRWERIKPYTELEKTWLQEHCQGEFYFLLQNGLSIYKDTDREKGRAVARKLIATVRIEVANGNDKKDDSTKTKIKHEDDGTEKNKEAGRKANVKTGKKGGIKNSQKENIKTNTKDNENADSKSKAYNESCESGDGDSDTNSFLEELEEDPMSHVADYKFSVEQLDWIKKHYKHSGNFLICHGFKPYDDSDCEDGKMIIDEAMADSGDEALSLPSMHLV